MSLSPATDGPVDKSLLVDRDAGVMTIRLNRPEARNALSLPMLAALGDALAEAQDDDDVRCVVLTGAGPAFCAGGDVKGMVDDNVSDDDVPQRIRRQQANQRRTSGALFRMSKPTICAINGPAAGAGLGLALACDMRIMAAGAFLTTAFAHIGLSGDFGATYFAAQLVGPAKARELFFLPERVPSEAALQLGLVNRVCHDDVLYDEVRRTARQLAGMSPLALALIKDNLIRAATASAEACMDMEVENHVRCLQSEDHRKAAAAFAARRA